MQYCILKGIANFIILKYNKSVITKYSEKGGTGYGNCYGNLIIPRWNNSIGTTAVKSIYVNIFCTYF